MGRHKIQRKKFQPFPVVPQHLIRIEKQVLPSQIAGHNCYAKKEYVGNERHGKPAQELLPEKHQKRTAGAISQQGEAYNHIGEMMVLNDGKKAHQEDLVGERHC
jgi:hypothetical protein